MLFADDDPLPFYSLPHLSIISIHVIPEMTFSAFSSLPAVNSKHFEKERQKKNNHNASEWINMYQGLIAISPCMYIVVCNMYMYFL